MKKIYTILFVTATCLSYSLQGQTTYNDVAKIFFAHCTLCHHEGGGGPMSLMTFAETEAWTSSISDAIQGKKGVLMPPWHADTAYTTSGHKTARFLDENVLTSVEKNKILQWIADGSHQGDASLVPEAPRYGDMTYKLNGTADLTVEVPVFKSNASASKTDPFNCFTIPANMTEDRWLRAYEVVPGNLEIDHHVFVNLDTTGTFATDTSGNCINAGGQIQLAAWVAGARPTVFPNDPSFKLGIRIPKGSSFVFNIHYKPGSGGQIDNHTKIRLFFYPKGTTGIRSVHSDVMLQNWGTFGFGAAAMPKDQIKTYSAISSTSQLGTPHTQQPITAMTLLGAGGHSHKLCTDIQIYASAGTDTIPVLKINNWNINWQGNYTYPKPLKIPAGHVLKAEHIYDNTVNNPHNIVPRADVNFGQATGNEMLFDSFMWLDYMAGDENIDMKALLANEPLLQVGVDKIETSSFQLYMYPNPASDNLTVYLSERSIYKARLLNIFGQTVLITEPFNDTLTVDLKNVPSGSYAVEIIDTKTNEKFSKKIIVSK